MLNGLDPIILFQFQKLSKTLDVSKIPVVSQLAQKISLPTVPIYLSERLTGLYVDTEDKNIDIETKIETTAQGADDPPTAQRVLDSTVKISMLGKKDSLGLILLSTMCDLIVPKVTSQEYSITYLHGATTVFEGLLHSFAVIQNANDDLLMISLEISKTMERTKKKEPTNTKAAQRVREGGVTLQEGPTPAAPTKPLKKPITGPAGRKPNAPLPSQPPVIMNRRG